MFRHLVQWSMIPVILLITGNERYAAAQDFIKQHGRSPNGFSKMEWPEMRGVLFGQYAPTEQEKEAIQSAIPSDWKPPKALSEDDGPNAPPRVLLFYRCVYPHASIATGCYALEQLGKQTGAFEATLSDDPTVFRTENLKQFDAVVLLHTTNYQRTIGRDGQAAMVDYLTQGGGLAAIHAAADSSYGWREGGDFMGGLFAGHPWLPSGTWAIRLESPDHRLNAAFDEKGFWLQDEIYTYRRGTFDRERSRVLLSLDMSKEPNLTSKQLKKGQEKNVKPDGDYPVAWVHSWRGGRVFYTNLGHNAETFRQPVVLRHYLDGVLFAAGRIRADTTPSAELETVKLAPAPDRE